jgi:hypothetical protein
MLGDNIFQLPVTAMNKVQNIKGAPEGLFFILI